MKMRRKKDVRERDARDAFRNRHPKISRLFGKILETTGIVMRAVFFVVAILAIELCIVGLCYVASGRW